MTKYTCKDCKYHIDQDLGQFYCLELKSFYTTQIICSAFKQKAAEEKISTEKHNCNSCGREDHRSCRECLEKDKTNNSTYSMWVPKQEKKSETVFFVETKETNNYKKISQEIAELVTEKNKAYGDSFAECEKFIELLYPIGIPVDKYKDALTLIRIWDKIKRIATDKDALGESPYSDIVGYCLLALDNINKTDKGDY